MKLLFQRHASKEGIRVGSMYTRRNYSSLTRPPWVTVTTVFHACISRTQRSPAEETFLMPSEVDQILLERETFGPLGSGPHGLEVTGAERTAS